MLWENLSDHLKFNSSLDLKTCTIEEALSEPDIIERSRGGSFKPTDEKFDKLLDYVLKVEDPDVFSKEQYKFSDLASELLVCPISCIYTNFFEEDKSGYHRLDKLFEYFNIHEELNTLSSSFVCRVISNLFMKESARIIPIVKNKPKYILDLLKHIDTFSVLDLLYKLFTQEYEKCFDILQFFVDESIVYKLLDFIDVKYSQNHHESITFLLNDLYSKLRLKLFEISQNITDIKNNDNILLSTMEDPAEKAEKIENEMKNHRTVELVLNQMESDEFLKTLIKSMLKISDNNQSLQSSVTINCITVLLSAINKRKSDSSFPTGQKNEFADYWISKIQGMSPASNENCTNGEDSDNGKGPEKITQDHLFHSQLTSCKVVRLLKCHLDDINKILLQPKNQNKMNNFGRCKVFICQLLSAVMSIEPELLERPKIDTENETSIVSLTVSKHIEQLNSAMQGEDCTLQSFIDSLLQSKTIQTLLNLFCEYPNNSFLHQTTVQIIQNLISYSGYRIGSDPAKSKIQDANANSQSSFLKPCNLKYLLKDCDIIEWILNNNPLPENALAQSKSLASQSKSKPRPGYSGFLWQLANMFQRVEEQYNLDINDISSDEENNEQLKKLHKNHPFNLYLSESTLGKWRTFQKDILVNVNSENKITDISQLIQPDLPHSNLFLSNYQNVPLLLQTNILDKSFSADHTNEGSGDSNGANVSALQSATIPWLQQSPFNAAAAVDDDEDYEDVDSQEVDANYFDAYVSKMRRFAADDDKADSYSNYIPATASRPSHAQAAIDLDEDSKSLTSSESTSDDDEEDSGRPPRLVIKQQRSNNATP